MKKAFFLGIAASFFFAATFVLNRSMNLAGGYWIWSASLRYLFTLPILYLLLMKDGGVGRILGEIKKDPLSWILWSTVGFGLFYAPLTMASVFGESWFVAATWQITIVAGVFLAPLFGSKIPVKNLGWSVTILIGVFLLQIGHMKNMELSGMITAFVLILIAAISYPLGNRKMMDICPDEITVFERVFGMTLCSMPFWILLSAYATLTNGLPSGGQVIQSLLVALFSGVAATLLFFQATNMVKGNQKQLAVVEATQSGEVVFTLLGGLLFLGDPYPSILGFIGIFIILAGMIGNSLAAQSKKAEDDVGLRDAEVLEEQE